eukprot:TRINITY_DN4004_c0_g1_i3.p1 TRINITY_DN4004_c0_g1~~TRINITY_DN4004_c0_g1_i3.p1  ORF type:complete len:330 (+),score=68.23 TRINITY_DN4004_c0_g1_i3:813-1802(+)
MTRGESMLTRLLRMQRVDEEDDDHSNTSGSGSSEAGGSGQSDSASFPGRPVWAASLLVTIDKWNALLPQDELASGSKKEEPQQQDQDSNSPLARCMARERDDAKRLVATVRADLALLTQVCKGEQKQSNHSRELVTTLTKGLIPRHWRRYTVPSTLSVSLWLVDLAQRVVALRTAQTPTSIWLGGLLHPHAFMTATRQTAARANSWSVERMELHVQVLSRDGPAPELPYPGCFIAKSLSLEAAAWRDGQLALTDQLTDPLPDVLFVWRLSGTGTTPDPAWPQGSVPVSIPAYINSERKELLLPVTLPAPATTATAAWYQRATAVTLQQF